MSDLRFYRAQERAMAPGIVKEWPRVFRMPRKVPHGRLVAVSVAEVVSELRENGYTVIAPGEPPSTNAVDPSAQHRERGRRAYEEKDSIEG